MGSILMRIVRILVAGSLVLCVIPILLLGLALLGAELAHCEIDFKVETHCQVGSFDIGPVIDSQIRVGVFGMLTAGIGAYIFASWVLLELAVMILRRS